MRRLLFLFACLGVVLSIGGGSIAHAMEPVICIEPGTVAAAAHSAGDGDEVPADADKGYPHHHAGCHGHHVAAPAELNSTADGITSPSRVAIQPSAALVAAANDPGLRPPQA